MSIVQKESIEVIAQSVGINNLTSEAALTLAPDVEYRMRELMQEAIKCMRHSRRTVLTTDDVDTALNIRNVEPVYGFVSGDPLRFKRAIGHPDLFYVEDKEVDFKDVIEAPLPKAPLDVSIMCHWLAIEGVQPAIPENAPVEVIPVLDGKSTNKDEGLPVDIKCPVKHVLSRELQLYFDKITELTTRGSDSVLFKQALVSLATDAGLHPLVPYFTCFVADEVSRGLGDFNLLFALMRLVQGLLKNPHIHLEHYLHQLMPSVVTCLVAKRLGNRLADNHWELRDFTARIVASICKRYGHAYNNLQPRLTRTLINAFLDPKRALTQHYGAIQGLSALGSNVVLQLILPNLEPYMRLLEPELLLENQKNEMKRHEAWRVYGALLHAAGQCIYGRLKKFPIFPSSSPNNILRKNGKVNAIPPGKRKASEGQIIEQPPLKKVATGGSFLNNGSSPSDGKNEMEKDASSSKQIPDGKNEMEIDASSSKQISDGKNEMEIDASSSKQISDGKNEMEIDTSNSKQISDGKNEMEIDASNSKQTSYSEKPAKTKDMDMKMSAILNQVWKDDLKSGQVLRSLFDLFGERILPFIPSPETSVFL